MAAPSKYLDDPDVVVDQARSNAGVLRIRRELAGRAWATQHGIPTAETLDADPQGQWLVSRRVADEPGEPWSYVTAAFDVGRRIEELPCPSFVTTEATWRAPRRTVALRVARMLLGGIDLRAFVAARTAFEQLPRDATVHNDFHRSNVLNSATPQGVTVIDWELTSLGPRHQDLVMLVVDLVEPHLAHAAWRLLADSVPAAEHPALAAQLRWLTLRTYASEITTAQIPSNPAKTERRRMRWVQAQDWAAELATDHREVS